MHVAVFSAPVPALVHPTFSVVSTLVRRGYRVTCVTSETFAREVSALGAEVLRCPRTDSPFNQDDTDAMPIEHQYARSFPSLAARTFSLMLPFYERNRPDLVIYDAVAFAGPMIADKVGARSVRMSNQFDFTQETCREVHPTFKEHVLELERQADELFALHHLRRRNVILESSDPTFYFYLSELQLPGSRRTQDVFHAARCTAERPGVAQWKRPTPRTKPSALFSSSTTYGQDPQYYKKCLLALSDLGWETFVSLGRNSTVADFDSLPAHCHPIQNVPLVAVMPNVDLIICAAGMATAMEALYLGIPMLMTSNGHAELEAYGRMFHSRGLGIHLNKADASPENVAHQAVRMANDPELRVGVRRMQEALKRSPGGEDLVNWLEERVIQVGSRPRIF